MIAHRPHARWLPGFIGIVEAVDTGCPACTVREAEAEARELAGRLAPGALDWMPDTLDRSRERAAVRARLRELAALIDDAERMPR